MALLTYSPVTSVCPKFLSDHVPNRKLKSFKPFTDSTLIRSKVRVRVSCRVKDFGVSDLDQNVSLRSYGQFSASVKQASRRSKEEEEKQSYYLNMGYAIRTLREEFPELFYRELGFDIYRSEFECLYSWFCLMVVEYPRGISKIIVTFWYIFGFSRKVYIPVKQLSAIIDDIKLNIEFDIFVLVFCLGLMERLWSYTNSWL